MGSPGWLAIVLAVAACNTPTPSLRLLYAGPPSQACPSTACEGVSMMCNAVMNIRIFDPDDPATLNLDQCIEFSPDPKGHICSIASVDLEPTALPVRDLEVEIAVYPASVIPTDPDQPDRLRCPGKVQFSAANGFPVEQWPTPALGGRTFYHPGDQFVTVTLGCTDLAAINESCASANQVSVTATVDDFDNLLPVTNGPTGTAAHLTVSIGEPRLTDDAFTLNADNTRQLVPLGGVTPTWGASVDLRFLDYMCIDVREDVAQSTAALRCRPVISGSSPNLSGVRISTSTLQKVLRAISPAAPVPVAFPDRGLTVGIVVDQASLPLSGFVVTPSSGTVQYMKDGELVDGATSNEGIFVSRDAPFGTVFSTSGSGRPTLTGIGGLVEGKVTIVILPFGDQPTL